MPVQIAIFSGEKDNKLENEVNKWLEDLPDIEIISQSICCGERDSTKDEIVTISILYRMPSDQAG